MPQQLERNLYTRAIAEIKRSIAGLVEDTTVKDPKIKKQQLRTKAHSILEVQLAEIEKHAQRYNAAASQAQTTGLTSMLAALRENQWKLMRSLLITNGVKKKTAEQIVEVLFPKHVQ